MIYDDNDIGVFSIDKCSYSYKHRDKYPWGGMSVEDAAEYIPEDCEVIDTKEWVVADPCWDMPGVDIYYRKK